MYQGIKLSGFGGQGVISAGVLLAQAGMMEGKEVSFFPSYGAEMRGGTANCSVVISSDEVTTPIVSEPDTVIVFNEPSLTKFEPLVKKGGLLIINSSLITSKAARKDIKTLYVPCNQIAGELGNGKVMNMVALGAFAAATGAITVDAIANALPKVYKKLKPEVIELNVKALKRGAQFKLN
ncbi:MAG: 2-oxoacid:ferredoxin oxidoreductase subunit gamma [Elusimicrobia bacterium GWC2_51_8]|nr:MAG: 2-oxoacid:ferredoxin oxidoreductase subunit gamma [Elusimicrobia bacterium GWA2_51_34]OGR65999.1 MAG: 2-oxoacid:ferredoxin oxidoreductase subunit gamma [Elusimicrobia bacterium GWC2_51_8]OGR88466.1 MAG: 2-oxoacid:ferredoxin oxidoreductase subunit gamma [Elusimicrobia bacterium GWF2_52_66]HAF95954.1 2-oxoacid:ferredoxin oxidoreductase subunit gamma [Elusimicrobiota bacterium]HCE97529.1 2-oxoacid:ferredoxin oxidoreductase subunit gamma [Elusimicrobiota bacterium]